MGIKTTAGWGSHLPVLMKVMSITDGPVLEMGMGIFSTPYLHWACFSAKRKLCSFDNDPDYFNQNHEYCNDYHEVTLVTDWDKIDIDKPWDVVLVDHAPCLRRKVDIMRLADLAKFIVVHDTDWHQNKHYDYRKAVFPFFKYQYWFTEFRPKTTVLSNLVDLKDFKV
jgi:hypothetical protein